MAFDADFGPRFGNHAGAVDQKGRAFDTHISAAVIFLLNPHPKGVAGGAVLVRRQGEIQVIFGFEIVMAFHRIFGNADDVHAGGLERLEGVAKTLSFGSTARRIIFWVK